MSASLHIEALGHVVIRVRELKRSEAFYGELLGIPVSARAPDWSMVFFTLGEHHDLAISAIGSDAVDANPGGIGLDHVAFRIAGGAEGLRAAKARLEADGVEVAPVDHVVTQSLYFKDPDGNGVELYTNGIVDWRSDPKLILSEAKALEL